MRFKPGQEVVYIGGYDSNTHMFLVGYYDQDHDGRESFNEKSFEPVITTSELMTALTEEPQTATV